MQTSKWLGIALATALGIGGTFPRLVQAVELSDGRVYFEQPPSLVDSSTTQNAVAISSVTYYFTISVPDNAGEPLQRVTIAQRDGDSATRRVEYDLEDTRAFAGTRGDRGAEIPLGTVAFDEDTLTVSVDFAEPIAPGTVVTIGLEPERNPRSGGVYLFGITAFPTGETPYGQFLGYGRFQFYERNGDFFPSLFFRHGGW